MLNPHQTQPIEKTVTRDQFQEARQKWGGQREMFLRVGQTLANADSRCSSGRQGTGDYGQHGDYHQP